MMKSMTVSGVMLTLLLVGILVLALGTQPVKSDWIWTETVYIRSDGSIDPSEAPISSVDNITYTLTDNIITHVPEYSNAIAVQRNNIVIDGAEHSLQGQGPFAHQRGINLTERSNVTIKNIEIKDTYTGIYLEKSSENNIFGNDIKNGGYDGIYLWDSYNNSIFNNSISNNWAGVALWRSSNNRIFENNLTANFNYWGISLLDSSNNDIFGNDLVNNWDAIQILDSSNYNNVFGNNISASNDDGIYLNKNSNYNLINENEITNNQCGIRLAGYSRVNVIYHNNFVGNTVQVSNQNPELENTWDDGYPSGGNYWSDYAGVDSDGDGIGDTPYTIGGANRDNYPFMRPLSPLPGDMDGDRDCDYDDFLAFAAAYLKTVGQPGYNTRADFNSDGDVDYDDFLIFAANYLKTI